MNDLIGRESILIHLVHIAEQKLNIFIIPNCNGFILSLLQQFLMKLECLTSVRPLPDRHLVETYIKAYYLPEGALEEWIQQNRSDYSPRQLNALVSTMTHVSKRTRQKISNLIEDSGKK